MTVSSKINIYNLPLFFTFASQFLEMSMIAALFTQFSIPFWAFLSFNMHSLWNLGNCNWNLLKWGNEKTQSCCREQIFSSFGALFGHSNISNSYTSVCKFPGSVYELRLEDRKYRPFFLAQSSQQHISSNVSQSRVLDCRCWRSGSRAEWYKSLYF